MRIRIIAYLCLLGILGSTSGCHRTTLNPKKFPAEIARLIAINKIPLRLHIETDPPQDPGVGHQYLFVLLPFGRIETSDLSSTVHGIATHNLALRGYKVLPNVPIASDISAKTVSIRITSLGINAFDLIFVRRPVCKIMLSGTLYDEAALPVAHWKSKVSKSRFSRFAFEDTLEPLLYETISEALEDILTNLRV